MVGEIERAERVERTERFEPRGLPAPLQSILPLEEVCAIAHTDGFGTYPGKREGAPPQKA